MVVIDLSHRIHAQMPVFPGDRPPAIRAQLKHESDACQVSLIEIGTHTGTHIDAPFHFVPEGARTDSIPVERFVGRGVLIDVRAHSAGQMIAAEVLTPYIAEISPGDFAIFRTGWDRFYDSCDYLRHPFLAPECARRLVDLRISLVGIDAMSVDPSVSDAAARPPGEEKTAAGGDQHHPAHKILLGNDVLIAENLCRLGQISGLKGRYAFLPLKLEEGDGSPVRAVFIAS